MTNSIHTFWELITTHRIEIPIIQRDYAQGRDTDETKDIRQGFVNELHKAIAENGEVLHLNLVYGKVKGIQNAQQLIRNKEAVQNMLSAVQSYSQTLALNIDFQLVEQRHNTDGTHHTAFIPLDGQQRLTTLFLLHWYLLKRLDKKNEINRLKNFSYKIRPSSKDFCEALIINPLTITASKLSAEIKDTNWFFSHWSKDPTVQGMLNMLDAIHTVFDNEHELATYWQNLQDGKIRFEFLDLDDFNLTDELYIKMNARGKHLTPFENFKAWLMEYVVDNDITIEIKNWEQHFDITWADLFWNNKGENEFTIDQAYMNFFRNMFQIFYVQQMDFKASNEVQLKNAQNLTEDNKTGKYIFLPNEFYSKIGVLTPDNLNTIFKIINLLSNKTKGINWLSNHLESIDFFNDRIVKNKGNEKRSLFKAFVSGSMSYSDKARFYALIQYLLKHGTDDFSSSAFFSWMRIVRNLVENTTIDDIRPFVRAVSGINDLVAHSDNIYDYLKKAPSLTGFNELQTAEEIRKVAYILEENRNIQIREDIFLGFENHAYFRGRIDFLLNMMVENGNVQQEFLTLGNKAAAIFTHKLKDGGDKKYLLERALLTIDYDENDARYLENKKTNYLIASSSNRWNFVKMTNNRHKKTPTWRNDFLPNCKEGDLFYLLLDKIDTGDEIKGLKRLIKVGKEEISDWRSHIIHHIENIDYCNQGFIRFNNETDILLYKESQSNHYHCELFSSGFYEAYRKKIEAKKVDISPFNNFWYHEVRSSSHLSCAALDDFIRGSYHYAMDIYFRNGLYHLRFFNRNKAKIEKKIKNALDNITYQAREKDGCYFYENIKTIVDIEKTP